MRNKNILISAYLNKNLGDDLFIKILLDRYPQHSFYIIDCEEDNLIVFSKYNNIKAIGYKEAIMKICKFDAFINIGGSIFQFKNTIWGSLRKRILIALLNKFSLGKNYIIGSNFGPYEDVKSIKYTKLYFKLCHDICLRDNYSYEIFKDLKHVRLTPDVVFSLSNETKQIKIKDSIGISIINIENRMDLKITQSEYLLMMKEIIRYFISMNMNVYLISFCSAEGDLIAINSLVKEFDGNKQLSILSYDGNIDNFLNTYSQLDKMICCRFHSYILSKIYEQNTYCIYYSKKLLNVLKDIKEDEFSIDLNDLNYIDMEYICKTFNSERKDINSIIFESERCFDKLDLHLLKKERK